MRVKLQILAIGVGIAAALTSVMAGDGFVTITPVSLPVLPLGLITMPSGKAVNLSVSPGAGAYRLASDPANRIWSITDRGPTFDCNEEREYIGMDDRHICMPDKRGKIYLLPGFAPSIYSIDISEKTARFSDYIPLKGASGKPLTGISSPATTGRPELAYGIDGTRLDNDPSGVEPGGLVRLENGTFWVAEEFGPSLLEIAPDGTVRRRVIPVGSEDDFKDADYPIQATLPAILRQRQVGRGFDGLAISKDAQFLFVALQNAPLHPDIETYRKSPLIRIWKIRLTDMQIIGQYLYTLDPPETYKTDVGTMPRPLRQSDVRLSELTVIGEDKLLVLERIRTSSKIYSIDLATGSNCPAHYSDIATRPALEELGPAGLSAIGLHPVEKRLIIDSEQSRGMGGRLSAMTVVSENELVLINNNDFGIDGSRTQMFRLTFTLPVLK